MSSLHNIVKHKPYLVWYVDDKDKLSETSLAEHIFNYGNWHDYLEAEKSVGIKKMQTLFQNIKSKKRINLSPQTINYFENYYQKYA